MVVRLPYMENPLKYFTYTDSKNENKYQPNALKTAPGIWSKKSGLILGNVL